MKKGELSSTDPYKGVRDFCPEDFARLKGMFDRIREVLGLWGYEEYGASPLERSELYESKGNEEIIREQTYSFEDRGGRRVTLRPEMTPSLARMVAARRRELPFPLRWYSIGNRFRYERPQKGRLREFFQADVDLVGLPEGEADVEILALASEILRRFGATEKDFVIRVNSRTLLSAACASAGFRSEESIRNYWRLLDKKSKMTKEEFSAARGPAKEDPLAIIEAGTDADVKKEKDKLAALLAALKERGVGNAVFDPEIVRGFDYYTGVIFEIFDTNPANPRSMFGGGRYDGLVSLFGGAPIPAIGFAIGDVLLADFLATHGYDAASSSALPQLYVGTPSSADAPRAQLFAASMRKAGVRTFVNLKDRPLGEQIKEAGKRDIPYFAAYGEQEERDGTIALKRLSSREEMRARPEDAAREILGTKES